MEQSLEENKKVETLVNEGEIGFLFNKSIASKIPAGGYTLAQKGDGTFQFDIKRESVDNFGNKLVKGDWYVAAVLAVFNPTKTEKSMFNSTLQVFQEVFKL